MFKRLMACLHEAIVAEIGRATDRRDDRTVQTYMRSSRRSVGAIIVWF